MFDPTTHPVRGTYYLNRDHYLARGLVAFWLLNEGGGMEATDLSGYNNNGSFLANTAAAGQAPASPIGISFNASPATSDSMNCGNRVSVQIATAVTICAWVNAVAWTVTANTFNGVIEKLSSTSPFYNYGLRNNAGSMEFLIGTGSTQIVLAFTTFPPTGKWCHLCGTYDGANMRAYLNGIAVGSVAQTGSMFNPAAPVTLGDNTAFTGRAMQGRMFNAMIYKRALPQREIVELVANPYAMLAPLLTQRAA